MSAPDEMTPYATSLRLWPAEGVIEHPGGLVKRLLEEVAARSEQMSASLIGHIECHVRGADGAGFHGRLTSSRLGAAIGGSVPESASELRVDLVVLVYGLEGPQVEAAVAAALDSLCAGGEIFWGNQGEKC
ncbi:MAG: hypothetical protein Kow00129_05680 [Thermoleophilia bacterium]